MRDLLSTAGAAMAIIIMIVFMVIYGMPPDGIIIAAGISSAVLAGFSVDGFVVKKRKIEQLRSIKGVGMFTMAMPPVDMLPPVSDEVDEQYQDLIRLMYADHRHMVSQLDRGKTETKEYYAEWERRIKVHIAAIDSDLTDKGVGEDDPLRENLRSLEQYVETALCYIEIQNGKITPVLSNQSVDRTLEQVLRRLKEKITNDDVALSYKPVELFVKTDERLLIIALEELIVTVLDRIKGGSMEITGEKAGNRVVLIIKAKPLNDNRHELGRMIERGLTPLNIDKKRIEGNELNVCREIFKALNYKHEVVKSGGVSALRIDMGITARKVDLWKPPQ